MIATGLRTLLLAQTAITSRVGQQVYVDQADQGAVAPYVVISVIQTDPMGCLDGTYGMRTTEVDVDCYAPLHVPAKELADAVTAFLKDYTGPAGDGETIDAVLWRDESDGPLPPTDGKGTGRHLVTVEFEIQHTPN